MSACSDKATRRVMRRLVGGRAAATVIDTAYDFQTFRRRGIWARFRWLLFGR